MKVKPFQKKKRKNYIAILLHMEGKKLEKDPSVLPTNNKNPWFIRRSHLPWVIDLSVGNI